MSYIGMEKNIQHINKKVCLNEKVNSNGLYYIDYEVIPLNENVKVTLSMVELLVNGKIVKY